MSDRRNDTTESAMKSAAQHTPDWSKVLRDQHPAIANAREKNSSNLPEKDGDVQKPESARSSNAMCNSIEAFVVKTDRKALNEHEAEKRKEREDELRAAAAIYTKGSRRKQAGT